MGALLVISRTVLVALALALPVGLAGAYVPLPPDELSAAYATALSVLRAGKDRQQIADRLKPVLEAQRDSPFHKLVDEFLTDLARSAKKPSRPGDAPEKQL